MTETRSARGKRIRAEVLGDGGTPGARRNELLDPLVELGYEFAWGSIWAREGIPVKTRRFLAIALLASQNRASELRMHLRAALAHDCTAQELQEVCIHVTCYCGFPAASEALRMLAEVVDESQATHRPPK